MDVVGGIGGGDETMDCTRLDEHGRNGKLGSDRGGRRSVMPE
jgi:hypothetical protein